MKQGTGNNRAGSQKVEPRTNLINLKAVAGIGIKQVYTNGPPSLVSGRGYKAPMSGSQAHKSGSQGKH